LLRRMVGNVCKGLGSSNIAVKRSLFTKNEFSFLKLNLVVRADLWAYVLRKATCWKAAPDALSRPSRLRTSCAAPIAT
jgi:hypothetical protein